VNHTEIASLEHASRSVMAYLPDEPPDRIIRVITATVPALTILIACAFMLVAIL
jgi:hypothetical protein